MSAARWKSIAAVVVDPFSKKQMAARKAAAIAERCGARLTLLSTFMLPQPSAASGRTSSRQIIAAATRERRLALENIAKGFRARGVTTRCIVRWDYPVHEAITTLAMEARADLLVSESHRTGKLGRWLLANTDWELIRQCPCPLWFARSEALPRALRILVAVDPRHAHDKPAELDTELLRTAAMMQQELRGKVSVVHAYEAPASAVPGLLMEPVRLPLSPRRARDFVAQTVQQVAHLAAAHRIPAAECYVQEGETSEVIEEVADSCNADVLMMGAVSRSLPRRAVIGSTAERVIDRVVCDVFVAKPPGFKAPRRRSSAKVS